jgi:HSP20 family protein
MATLSQLREGLTRAWETLAEGWSHLRSRAAHALTHFQPSNRRSGAQFANDQVTQSAARWGLLPAEVIEQGSDIVVKLEIAGMRGDDFEIQTAGDMLVVRGEKVMERNAEDGRYHVLERAYGRFERAIPLPTVVRETGARASYKRGVLQITLPKAQEAGLRRIPVERG